MKRVLLIDDFRDFDDVTLIARTGEKGIEILKDIDNIDLLYLDHDLGDGISGYDVMCWLENNPYALPTEIVCVSANPVGRDRINMVIKKLYE